MLKILDLKQGGEAWHSHRKSALNASDAPAMMSCSSYKTRDQLIAEKATGMCQEVDAATQRRFDEGHRFEALARPLAEAIVGSDLYPVVATNDGLSASLDGITMLEDVAFEHKRLNQRLREVLSRPDCTGADLPLEYQIQMEQQCAVSGCERVLFMASEWDESDQLVEELHCWYTPNMELRAAIVAGWAQLHKDVAAYEPPAAPAAPVVGRAPDHLPALLVEIKGEVTASNLDEFKNIALTAIRSVNRDLKTDQDFADSAKARKWCEDIESRVKATKEHAMAQTASIDMLFKALDEISAEARDVRIALAKEEKQRSEALRGEAVANGVTLLRQHIAELHASVGRPWVQVPQANFGAVIKGMRSLDSIRGAINDELARCKIEADAQARRIVANIRVLDQAGHGFLFPDAQQLATAHDADTFAGLVQGRIAQHQAAEQKRMDAERERIRAEEVAKLQQRETAARAQAEATARAAAVIAQAASPSGDVVDAEIKPGDRLPAMAAGYVPIALLAEDTSERINLGAINEHLAPIKLDAAGLALLGFEPVATVKASKLYCASSMPAIRTALVAHLSQLAQLEAV